MNKKNEIRRCKKVFVSLVFIFTLFSILNCPFVNANGARDFSRDGFSFNFKETELKNAFRQLGELSKMNIVTTDSVEGEITMFLNSVSIFEALDILTSTKNLNYLVVHNTIIIGTTDEIKERKNEERATKIYHLNNVKPSIIEGNIQHLTSEIDTIKTNDDLNNILITSSINNLQKIERVISNLDIGRRQIAVKVEFIEVSHSESKNIGVDWSSLNFNSENGLINIGGNTLLNYEVLLRQLENKGVTKTLANPRLTTVEGQEASINIGDKIPVIKSRRFDEDGREEVVVEYEDLGISLSLTPKITEDGNVLIDLEPEVTNFVNWVEVGEDRYPEISVKQLKTQVEVKDKNTIAIGGLIQHGERERNISIPLLNRIPFFGNKLFSYSSVTLDKRELIIFITPEIITNKNYSYDGIEIVNNKNHDYITKKGDTFVNLSRLFNVPFVKIMEQNKGVPIKELPLNYKINIPIPENRFYKVEKGEDYKTIAGKLKINKNDLKTMNNNKNIEQGSKIVIK